MAIDTWQAGAAGYWDDDANWSGGVPVATSTAYLDDSLDEVTIDDAFVAKTIINLGAIDLENANGAVSAAIVNEGLLTIGLFSLFSPTPTPEYSTVTAGEIVNKGALFLIGDDSVTTDALFNTFTGGYTTLFGTPVPDGTVGLSDDSVLDVHSAAQTSTKAGVLTGEIELEDAALLEFDSGGFTTISALGALVIFGSEASVAIAGQSGVNNALDTLATVAGGLALENGASVSTENSLAVMASGAILLDAPPPGANEDGFGGSSLSVSGTLSNAGLIAMGVVNPYGDAAPFADDMMSADNFSQSASGALILQGQAAAVQFDVSGPAQLGNAVGHITGYVALGDDALIAFGSGQITTIDSGAQLVISGPEAFIADASDETSSSALTGLRLIANAELDMDDGATLATTGSLSNSGDINLYGLAGFESSLTVGGSFLNNGAVSIDDDSLFWVKGAAKGSGSISVADGGQAEIDGAVSGESLTFLGSGEFVLGQAMGASVGGFQSDDSVDFSKVFYNAHETLSVTEGASDDAVDVLSPKGSIIASIDIGLNSGVQPAKFDLGADSTGHVLISWS